MRHLIVEACIARNLLDTSAYFWPGYVNGHSNQLPRSVAGPMPSWSSLMKGSPVTPMKNVLVSTPASRYAAVLFFYLFIFHVCVGVGAIRLWFIQILLLDMTLLLKISLPNLQDDITWGYVSFV